MKVRIFLFQIAVLLGISSCTGSFERGSWNEYGADLSILLH